LQIEVTPTKMDTMPPPSECARMMETKPPGTPTFDIIVVGLTNISVRLTVSSLHTVEEVKQLVQRSSFKVPPDEQRLIWSGKQLEDSRKLGDYTTFAANGILRITEGDKAHLVLRLRGGGDSGPTPDMLMGVAPGGLIRQTIIRDEFPPTIWEPSCGIIFNVQILNSAVFRLVTGIDPPSTPVTAEEYAKHGYPYFEIFDEKPSGIKGDLFGVKSVNEMDFEGEPSMEKTKAVAEVIKSTSNPVMLLDENGQQIGFRSLSDLEKSVRERFNDTFSIDEHAGISQANHGV
jgi:hypothetical protein